jgi:hypothetical protein
VSEPVVCITCGAVSYNDPGKTALHCHGCYEGLAKEVRRLREELEDCRYHYPGRCDHAWTAAYEDSGGKHYRCAKCGLYRTDISAEMMT